MKIEYSGNLYKLWLDFDLGFRFAELLDFSDIRDFDGLLVQVYKCKKDEEIEQIKASGVLLGPMPINKYPNTRGKGAWKYIGKSLSYSHRSPFFKNVRANIVSQYDWAKLSPWFKSDVFNFDSQETMCDYEEVRNLETLILNHPRMIVIKASMLCLINQNQNVGEFYDLTQSGNRNMYLQIVNTYFDAEKARFLIDLIL